MTDKRLEQAIKRLASLFEYGALRAEKDPAGFLESVCNEIEYYRRLIKDLCEKRTGTMNDKALQTH